MTGEPSSSFAPALRRPSTRIVSLDQFRGYTVLGMFVVNFVGYFAVTPAIFKHHNTYCSYADTIMPQFFFAVGFAYRLTFFRRLATMDRAGVYRRFLRRIAGLILLGAFLYISGAALETWTHPQTSESRGFFVRAIQTELFQALVHIGVTSLWIMPVIAAGAAVRIAFAIASAALHAGLAHWFYYDWVMTTPGIDGGVLGFLTWTIPTLTGSLAYDAVAGNEPRASVGRLASWGFALMLLGYGLSCLNLVTPPNAPTYGGIGGYLLEPPFVPPTRPVNLWTMNQQAGSVSYLTFGAGLSMALLALFVWACDVHGFQVGILRTLGTNALAGYVIHMVVDTAVKPFLPQDSSPGLVLAALAAFLTICYLAVRGLETRGIFLRL